MSVKAVAKGVKLSHRKVGEVAALVRGRSVSDAITILDHTPRRAAFHVKKVINSAVANADYNHNYKPDTLSITTIFVTPGRSIKRVRPAARGQALRFIHPSSHITVIVDGEQRQPKKKAVEATTKEKAEK